MTPITGTLYGIPLSQRVDINGKPFAGALLYLYQASTSIPVNSYSDFGLSLLNPNPLQADSAGTIPQFWLADGTYRARLTNSTGSTVIFDFDSIIALGPSSGTGGGSPSVDPTAVMQTGDHIWVPVKGIVRSGWVMSNFTTIGSVASGATQRANADTQNLYLFLWTNFPDSICPVGGGRGGNALADFNANKPIATLDMRSYTNFGLDDMGTTAAGRILSGTPTIAATTVGQETTSIAIAQANLPNVTFAVNITDPGHTHSILNVGQRSAIATSGSNNAGCTNATLTTVSATTGITASAPSGGSGTAIISTTISPGRVGTWYCKL